MWDYNISYTLWIGTLPLTALFALTLMRSRMSPQSRQILLLLVFCRTMVQFEILASAAADEKIYPYLIHLSFPFKLLGPMLLYFFFRSVLMRDFVWSTKLWPHALPFLLGWIYYFALITTPFAIDSYLLQRYLLSVVWLIVALPYLYNIRLLLMKTRSQLMNSRSDLDQLHLGWLKSIIYICYFTVSLSMLDVLSGPRIPLWQFDSVINAVALSTLLWTLLKTSALFDVDDVDHNGGVQLSEPEKNEMKRLLDTHLREKRLYLQPGLKLSDLAQAMGKKPYVVSHIIKHEYHSKFYDLVNQMRIEEAKRLLKNEADAKILAVAMDCGFNSKSTFNDTFRRSVGMTPSEYKQSYRSNLGPN